MTVYSSCVLVVQSLYSSCVLGYSDCVLVVQCSCVLGSVTVYYGCVLVVLCSSCVLGYSDCILAVYWYNGTAVYWWYNVF